MSLDAQDLGAREDGCGTRRLADDRDAGRVEVLALSPGLSTPAAEQAIRARAARLADIRGSGVAAIDGISRSAQGLSVTTALPEGITLADVLAALEFGTVKLADDGLVAGVGEMAGEMGCGGAADDMADGWGDRSIVSGAVDGAR